MTRTLMAWMLLAALASASQAQRDATSTPTSGAASISGIVVDDETPARPVRRAIVQLTGAGLVPSRGAITDDDGTFTLKNLPAGRFLLSVTRAAFVTSMYGAKRPGRPGSAILLVSGQHVDGLVVKMWRGVAIAGVVRDENGLPAPNITVTAIPARRIGPTGILTLTNNGTKTNSRGEYRIFGLEPDTYVVSATPSAGGGGPLIGPTTNEIDAMLAAVQTRAAAPPAAPLPAPPAFAAKPFAYAPVYFPGTATTSQATPIALAAGQERTDVDFSLERVPTATVSGVVTRPDGSAAADAALQLTNVPIAGPFTPDEPIALTVTAGADGAFHIPQVTPGEYTLIARLYVNPPPPPRPGMGRTVSLGMNGPSLWADAHVSVAGGDVSGLALTVEPGLTIAGRIVFDGAKPPTVDFTRLQVWLKPPHTPSGGMPMEAPALATMTMAHADGTFDIADVVPGPYQLSVASPLGQSGWWLRSAMLGDLDLLDGEATITREATSQPLTITFSDRHTELSGTLQSASGAAVSDVFVIAFAADRKFWLPAARRVQAVRPDADGRYAFHDLPPGDYLISAVTDVDPDEWLDPAFLDKLAQASAKVSITEGGTTVQDLRVGGE